MNLVDSHDTERILWTLTPATRTRRNASTTWPTWTRKARMKLAALIQMTMPGAPTIYYGDEAVSGDDDPDDRRTYPWGDANTKLGTRASPIRDAHVLQEPHQDAEGQLRAADGQLKFLLADDATGVLAYARKS